MATASPQKRRQARTREAILDAARELIAERGADNVSLRAIARHVEYSPAGLYEYFDGKDAIIDALCVRGNNQLVRYLKAVDTDLPLQEYFVQLLRRYVDFARENPEFYALMFTQSPSTMEQLPEDPHPDDAFTILLSGVQRGIDEGMFHTRDDYGAFGIAYNFWAMAHGTAMLQTRYLTALDFDFAAADAIAVEAFLEGLRSV